MPITGLDKDGVKKYCASFGNIEKETASGKISFRFPIVNAVQYFKCYEVC
ncbi:MAG: hypothetical protein LBK25_06910 [Treponema sp.]|jgi:hypothetical protein|nr:hypothetical protein [Treponema sp.]